MSRCLGGVLGTGVFGCFGKGFGERCLVVWVKCWGEVFVCLWEVLGCVVVFVGGVQLCWTFLGEAFGCAGIVVVMVLGSYDDGVR